MGKWSLGKGFNEDVMDRIFTSQFTLVSRRVLPAHLNYEWSESLSIILYHENVLL